MPGEVAGEHADQHVGFDAFFEPVEYRAQVQVVGFDVAEVPLDVFEVLVGGHDAGSVELAGRYGGAQHVEPVEGGLGADLVLPPCHGQAGIGDGDLKVLAGLVLADHLAHLDADVRGAGQPPGGHAGGDGGEQFLGGGQQVLPLAGAVGGQYRVAAGDQPLAGKVRRGDLGQVLLVEQGQLERAVVGHEPADGRGAQRGDPPIRVGVGAGMVSAVQLVQRGDPGAGDHAAVPDHGHLGQPEGVPHDLHDLGECDRVAGGPGEDPDRNRAAGRVGEQPVLDLQPAFLAVPGIAAGRQRAVRAFQPRGRQVE